MAGSAQRQSVRHTQPQVGVCGELQDVMRFQRDLPRSSFAAHPALEVVAKEHLVAPLGVLGAVPYLHFFRSGAALPVVMDRTPCMRTRAARLRRYPGEDRMRLLGHALPRRGRSFAAFHRRDLATAEARFLCGIKEGGQILRCLHCRRDAVSLQGVVDGSLRRPNFAPNVGGGSVSNDPVLVQEFVGKGVPKARRIERHARILGHTVLSCNSR